MPLRKLGHFSIRTTEIEATRRFYVDVLGMTEGYRPPFKFPGLWLYMGGDEADFGTVHVIGIDKDDPQGLIDYLGPIDETDLHGSAAVDHIAFLATDLAGLRERLEATDFDYRERTVPGLGLHQVFIDDPSGVTVELNFPSAEATAQSARADHANPS